MRSSRLLILAAVVLALGAWIYLYERKMPTTEEARQQADKVLPKLDRDQVTAMEITNEHGHFRLEKHDGSWQLVKPIQGPADDGTVGALLSQLVNLKAERTFAKGEVDPGVYGLDTPSMKVELTTKDGTTFKLEVGTKTALGSNRAVTRGDGKILLCAGWFANDLDKDLDAWRSHSVVDVSPSKVASLDIRSGEDHIKVVRDGRLWRLLDPIKDLADRRHVEDLITDINGIRIKEFLDAKADLGPLGLDHPERTVTIVRTNGAKPVELEFGKTREVNGAKQVACRSNGKDLFWVNDKGQVRLGKAPVLWRSPVLYPFDSWDVDHMEISAGGRTVTLDRSGGVWKLADGSEADGSAVLSRLSKLSQMKATDFDLVTTSTPEIGRITLVLSPSSTAEGKEKKAAEGPKVSFVFRKPFARKGHKALVTVSARDTVMGVQLDEAESLFRDLDALKKTKPTPTPEPVTKAAKQPEAQPAR